MRKLLLLFLLCNFAHAEDLYPGLHVEEKRKGDLYFFEASFDTPLSGCAAYRYLTDYEAAKALPGVIESVAHRLSENQVRVERTAFEEILFFNVKLHSVMQYSERPFDGISFTQLSGDSRIFRGNWRISPNPHGSTLRFDGVWEPDSMVPDFVIDYFAKSELAEKFSAVAELAEKRKYRQPAACSVSASAR